MRKTAIPAFLFLLMLSGVRGVAQSGTPESWLDDARQALKGEHKEPAKARELLQKVIDDATASPDERAWADIYLGYIEDRAGNRQAAIACYQKAGAFPGISSGTAGIAELGLERPIRWLRHLDAADEEQHRLRPLYGNRPEQTVATPASAYVTPNPPRGLTPAAHLSSEERHANLEALWNLLDKNYAHFELKGIDWNEVGRRYRARLDHVSNDADFYALMFQLVNELKDTHSWLENSRPAPPPRLNGVAIELFGGRPFIVSGEYRGWEAVSVDGMSPAQKADQLRTSLHACSSERAFQREAAPFLLAGDQEQMNVTLRSSDGTTTSVNLFRGRLGSRPASGPRPPSYLTQQRYVHFGRDDPSGLGYIWIESFNGREEIDREFQRALDVLHDTPGLILDIRNNAGGFGHPEIIGRFFSKRTLFGYSYTKAGSRHNDLKKYAMHVEPSGTWQYTRPVALLVNDVTGSAADLFATQLRSSRQVITVGTTTHGNLSGVATYGVLPCGLVVRISNGYITDAKGRAIEGNGNVPNVIVEPTVQDFLAGRDVALERAIAILLSRIAQN
jgi:C-terminal processing protease CtpA/Prc